MPRYWIPPRPGEIAEPPAARPESAQWLFGLCATYDRWPREEYSFRLPPCGIPLLLDHRERQIVTSGVAPGDVGVARRFAEIPDLGVVCLLEVSRSHPTILWDIAEDRRSGLSVKAHLDPPPGGGPDWVYLREVSLTSAPADSRARVASSGVNALADWELLTGEVVAA
jgi:hypothetical protein